MVKKCLALVAILASLSLVGCSKATVVPVSSNMVRVMVDAHPSCGPTGAQKLAVDTAAVATIQGGYDRFRVLAFNDRSVSSGVWTIPQTTTFQGNTAITGPGFSGIARRHHNALQVQLFRDGDPEGADAIDARRHLGVDWQKKVKRGVSC